MSPYLFMLIMKVLTFLIKLNVHDSEVFRYHCMCEEKEIVIVCFADDLFLFSYANTDSVKLISESLNDFKDCTLPVRYLGVPLASSALYVKDCKVLVDRVKQRVEIWKNKLLSFVRRLQLINSVLSSLQVHWSSVFLLLDTIIQDIERILRWFLWCQGELKCEKAKVK
ncbi:uncharacterized protein [Rutidosis leptorrhynchoides]|uniref:uncharacterized protein n=1 Tax=Rutidosis leptorrhynchoides TaxID=125765 RepID=UPI003A99B36C